MLDRLDDYPIHQTPEPLAHPATSDRNVYDRSWFNGYAEDGSAYFGVGMAVYPHRGILDCAFSVVDRGGRQHAFHGSRRAPLERTEMEVGPFRIEVVEPSELALLAPENIHVQQVVRATDGSRSGIGVLEQVVVGPYAPAGFTDYFDGAA